MITHANYLKLMLFVSVIMSFGTGTSAQTYPGYKNGFAETKGNKRGEYNFIIDPTGTAPSRKVHQFKISPGCVGEGDCIGNSVRSQLFEGGPHVPAPDGWYAWSMYIPNDFKTAEQQPAKGYYTFAQWKNHGCPHVSFRNVPRNAYPGVVESVDPDMLYIETAHQLDNGDCKRKARIPVISMNKLRGGWHRFEVYAEWSHGDDGRFEVYVDGEKYVDFKGSNQTIGWDHNYFQFGLYLCCSNDADKVHPSTVYYANISKSKEREKLK